MAESRTYPPVLFSPSAPPSCATARCWWCAARAAPANGVYSLPGGVVEAGETLAEAVKREIDEETALTIEPVALAGYREVVARDAEDKVERHFVILPFAARWIAGEPKLNEELSRMALGRSGRGRVAADHAGARRDRGHRGGAAQGGRLA